MMGLTQRQSELLQFLRAHKREHGVMPTLKQMIAALGWNSKATAHYILTGLETRGFLRRVKFLGTDVTRPGGIELVAPEYNHEADCLCERCPARRVQYQQFIDALQVAPPVALAGKLTGLRAPDNITRLYWRSNFPRSAKPSPQSRAGALI